MSALNPRLPSGSHGEAGFNLIEVLVAMALLGVVMLSISGLFVQGSNSIKGGKDMTAALAQATDILEDIHQLSYRRLYLSFGAADADTSFSADTRVNAFASRWHDQLQEAVWQGYAIIDLTPIGLDTVTPGCATTTFGCGQGIRIQVTVHWDERGRDQELTLSTMRF